MAKTSTNALTARYCAMQGWPCETVQTWRGRVRHDLFGIADTIAIIDSVETWIQNCSYGTLKKHRDEISKNKLMSWIDKRGHGLELWEWRRKKADGRYQWFRRVQTRVHGGWINWEKWEGPFDLYPKKKTK